MLDGEFRQITYSNTIERKMRILAVDDHDSMRKITDE